MKEEEREKSLGFTQKGRQHARQKQISDVYSVACPNRSASDGRPRPDESHKQAARLAKLPCALYAVLIPPPTGILYYPRWECYPTDGYERRKVVHRAALALSLGISRSFSSRDYMEQLPVERG